MHWIDPLLVPVNVPLGASSIEAQQHITLNLSLQSLTIHYLRTGQDGDRVEDCLAQMGINPHEYWQEINDTIDSLAGETPQIEALAQMDGYVFDLAAGSDGTLGLAFPVTVF
jgi:hypothetical protein